MKTMLILSLLLNIAVLIPVCGGLVTKAPWVQAAYGEATAARAILLSVYISILLASALFLVIRDPRAVSALLAVQIIYKFSTPITVGSIQNPVVISNLLIATFHVITLLVIWNTIGNPFRE